MASTAVHFPPQLLERIDAVARRQGVSRNRFVMRACQDAVGKDAGEWSARFFFLDLDPTELAVLREAGAAIARAHGAEVITATLAPCSVSSSCRPVSRLQQLDRRSQLRQQCGEDVFSLHQALRQL